MPNQTSGKTGAEIPAPIGKSGTAGTVGTSNARGGNGWGPDAHWQLALSNQGT